MLMMTMEVGPELVSSFLPQSVLVEAGQKDSSFQEQQQTSPLSQALQKQVLAAFVSTLSFLA